MMSRWVSAFLVLAMSIPAIVHAAAGTSAAVAEVSARIGTAPTRKDNFHQRWYLLDNWVKAHGSTHRLPFSAADLVSVRIAFYRDDAEASAQLDRLYREAAATLKSGLVPKPGAAGASPPLPSTASRPARLPRSRDTWTAFELRMGVPREEAPSGMGERALDGSRVRINRIAEYCRPGSTPASKAERQVLVDLTMEGNTSDLNFDVFQVVDEATPGESLPDDGDVHDLPVEDRPAPSPGQPRKPAARRVCLLVTAPARCRTVRVYYWDRELTDGPALIGPCDPSFVLRP